MSTEDMLHRREVILDKLNELTLFLDRARIERWLEPILQEHIHPRIKVRVYSPPFMNTSREKFIYDIILDEHESMGHTNSFREFSSTPLVTIQSLKSSLIRSGVWK